MKHPDKTGWRFKEVQVLSDNLEKGSTSVLKLLFPFVAAGLFYLWDKKHLAAIVAGITLSLLLLRFVAPGVSGLVLRALAYLGKQFGKMVSFICLMIFYIVIFVPTGFINRLIGRDPLDFKWLPASRPYWTNVPEVDPVRLFDKPFLSELPQSNKDRSPAKLFRVSRVVYNTALSVLLLNLAIGFVYHTLTGITDREKPDLRINSPVYADSGWAEEYFREFRESSYESYQPFIGWLREDYSGKYINIKNGIRKSYQSHAYPDKPLRLYVFGGSSIWGTGVSDDHTIPSYIAKFSELDRIPLEVQNFGELGFVNWQNVIRLSELCAGGKVPDLVIFYEGINDAAAKLQNAYRLHPSYRGRIHQNLADWEDRHLNWRRNDIIHIEVMKWFKDNSLFHIIGRKIAERVRKSHPLGEKISIDQEQIHKLAVDTVSIYAENAEYIRNIAKTYGFKVWFYWQPALSTRVNSAGIEQGPVYRDPFGGKLGEVYRAATREIRLKDFVIDLSGIFDGRKETVYIDFVHTGELGNQIIAEKMYEQLLPTLRTIVDSGDIRHGLKGNK